MADEQVASKSCLHEDQSGKPVSRGRESADLPKFSPLSEEEATQILSATDSTILPPEPDQARGVQPRGMRLDPPSISKVFQGRAATPQARAASDIRVIVLHTPEGHVDGTLSVLTSTRASFDFFLPLSGALYRCNDYRHAIAWHAGDWSYNQRSIGIEQGDFAANAGQFPDDHYRRLAYVVAYLIQTTATPLHYAQHYGEDGIIDHRTITPQRRSDPGLHFNRQLLMELVQGHLNGTETSSWALSSTTSGGITWKRGRFTAGSGAVARREHERGNNVMRLLEAGTTYTTDGYTDSGEHVAGSSRWLHLSQSSGYGWVHTSGGTYTAG